MRTNENSIWSKTKKKTMPFPLVRMLFPCEKDGHDEKDGHSIARPAATVNARRVNTLAS